MSYINKEAAIDLIESMIADKGVAFNPHKLAMALKDMESVEIPEAKDTDLISRQSAIDAVEKAVFKGVAKSAIESLPPVELKPVCEDAISRADTIEAMCSKCVIKEECIGECSDVVVIKNMPPVQPERPKGDWKLVDHLWECDCCQYRQNKSKPTNFCPNCGADCRGEKE